MDSNGEKERRRRFGEIENLSKDLLQCGKTADESHRHTMNKRADPKLI